MIATAAFAVFLMSAFNLCAEEATKPSTGDPKAVDSSVAAVADPAAPLPAAPMAAAMPYSAGLNIGTPKVELFLGYSYLRAVPQLAAGNRLVWLNGGSANIAYNFNRYLGIVADVGALTNSEVKFTGAYTSTVDVNNANVNVLTYLFGPRLSYRKYNRITPFAQVLFGGAHANEVALTPCTFSCTLLPSQNTFAMTAGGGLDIKVHRHIALRIIQAEYLMTRFQDYATGTTSAQNDMRISAGIVFRFGGNPPLPPPLPVTYSCSVNPTSVFPGDAIAVSGTALNLNPAKTAVYTWSVNGGTVTGVTSTAKIDTTGLAPGAYTLKGHVSEGARPEENADCTTPYAVRAYEPPTVSCTANPATVLSGDPSTITAIGISPQNRPLTYSYSSTSGSVSGSGTTATLSTVGAPFGAVGVTCSVVDDKGQTASGTTSVTVTAPVVAAKPVTSDLCSVRFDRDPRRPARVNNEGKACLDEIALNLQRNSDAQLAVVGNAASGEKNGKKLATERAVNTKAYLVTGKGIDSSRITVYTGSQDGKVASTTLIPAGATFDSTGDTPVQ
jgi:opacity protein-like surface antigen/outer membrane protein OmpA-like peptidoglycan-associated protein